MITLKRLLFECSAIAAYWIFAFSQFVQMFRPAVSDFGELSMDFDWGSGPHTVGTVLHTYYVAASIMTVLGCGLTPLLVWYWKPKASRIFWISTAVSFVSLALVAAIVGIGNTHEIWRGPPVSKLIQNLLPCMHFALPWLSC